MWIILWLLDLDLLSYYNNSHMGIIIVKFNNLSLKEFHCDSHN